MTNQEAIAILENEKNNHINEGKGFYYVTRTEAVDMAISALTAIDAIKKIINSELPIQEDVMRYKMICEIVKEREE